MKLGIVSAAVATPYFEGKNQASKNKPAVPLWRVLMDSGSDGDLLFRKKGKKTHNVPYMIRSVPQSWHTSNCIFSTEKIGNLDLVFPEYSHSKRMHITLDIVEFKNKDKAPMFDLIIGTETMQRLGIVLDFKTKMIIIDEIILPMRKLKNLQSQNALTTIYGHTEPIATLHETKRMV